ncbi:MAG: hypothetical protein AAFU61_11060, partial [Pseudomonadota bacterium]
AQRVTQVFGAPAAPEPLRAGDAPPDLRRLFEGLTMTEEAARFRAPGVRAALPDGRAFDIPAGLPYGAAGAERADLIEAAAAAAPAPAGPERDAAG